MIRPVVILILSFIAFESSQGGSVDLQNLPDDATRIFQQFRQKINASISSTNEILNDYKNIKESSDFYYNKGKKRINDTYMALLTQLYDFEELAKNNNIDIYNCTYRNQLNFSKLYSRLIKDLSYCINQNITKALNIINNAIKFVSGQMTVVDNLGQQLKDCGTGSLCLSTIIGKITLEDGVLTQQISNKLIDTSRYLINVPVELENCDYTKLKSMVLEGGDLAIKMNDCIYDRISNNTIF